MNAINQKTTFHPPHEVFSTNFAHFQIILQHDADKQKYHFHYEAVVGYDRFQTILPKVAKDAETLGLKMVGHGKDIHIYGNNWIKVLRGRAAIKKIEFERNQQGFLDAYKIVALKKTIQNYVPQGSVLIADCFSVHMELIGTTLKKKCHQRTNAFSSTRLARIVEWLRYNCRCHQTKLRKIVGILIASNGTLRTT